MFLGILPWLLIKGPPGSYAAMATVGEMSRTTRFTMASSGQKELTLMFPGGVWELGCLREEVRLYVQARI